MYDASINNLSPLPFYIIGGIRDKEPWDSQRWYSFGKIESMFFGGTGCTFFIDVGFAFSSYDIKFYKLCNKSGTTISTSDFELVKAPSSGWSALMAAGIKYFESTFMYRSYLVNNPFLTDGYYYMEISFTKDSITSVFRSEVFRVLEGIDFSSYLSGKKKDNFLILNWNNSKDMVSGGQIIPFSRDLETMVGINSSLGTPSYEYEEEGEERMGYFYPTKQLSYKKYKFSFTAPEYMCDVLRLVPLCDRIVIWDLTRLAALAPTNFSIDFNWLEGGQIAEVNCEFTTDTVVNNIGKDINFNNL